MLPMENEHSKVVKKYRVNLGHVNIDGEKARVGVDVRLETDKEGRLCLAISGEITGHSWGQIEDTISRNILSFPPKERKRIRRLCFIWRKYHLNDMHAGTKLQEQILNRRKKEYRQAEWSGSYYQWACAVLEEEKLLVQDGYRYGTKWLYRELPKSVVAEVMRGL